ASSWCRRAFCPGRWKQVESARLRPEGRQGVQERQRCGNGAMCVHFLRLAAAERDRPTLTGQGLEPDIGLVVLKWNLSAAIDYDADLRPEARRYRCCFD